MTAINHITASTAILRPVQLSDLTQLVALESISFPPLIALDRQGFRYFLLKSQAKAAVVEQNGEILAYAIVAFRPSLRLSRLYSIAVSPKARGQKIGERLMRWAIEIARNTDTSRMLLEVHTENQVALNLYQKLGFQIIKTLSPYYDDGSDAYKLELKWDRLPAAENLLLETMSFPFATPPETLWQHHAIYP